MRLQPSPQQEHRHQSWQIGLLRGGGLWVGDASCHRSSARDEPMIDCLQHGPFPIVRANPSGPIPNKLRTLGWHLGFLSLTLIDQERLFGERRITSKFRASSELNQLHANLKKDPLQTCWTVPCDAIRERENLVFSALRHCLHRFFGLVS